MAKGVTVIRAYRTKSGKFVPAFRRRVGRGFKKGRGRGLGGGLFGKR